MCIRTLPPLLVWIATWVGLSASAAVRSLHGSKDLAVFAVNTTFSFNLPLLHQTNSLFCYDVPAPTLSCDSLLSLPLCRRNEHHSRAMLQLLKTEWPAVTYWFSQLHSTYNHKVRSLLTQDSPVAVDSSILI